MTKDRFAPLLPFHLNGTLSKKERASLELHLPGCPACRALLEEARWARELGSGGPWDEHVQAQHLDRFALDPEGMSRELTGRIRAHVEICDACRSAVDRLRRTADAGDLFPLAAPPPPAQPEADREPAPGLPSRRGWIARTLLHPIPAAAYLVLLLLLIPWALLRTPIPTSPGRGAPAGVVDLPVLRAPLRGAADEVTLVREGPTLPLAIELPVESMPDAVPLRLSIGGANASPMRIEIPASRVERALAGTGLLVVLLPAEALEVGSHPVEVRRLDRDGGPPLLTGRLRVVAGE